jgi:hypothetical protein
MGSLTVGDVIRELLPEGTRPRSDSSPSWHNCPNWAPDLFAVAATLAERSGSYTEPGIVLSRNAKERAQKLKNAELTRQNGRMWAARPNPPAFVRKNWTILFNNWAEDVCCGVGKGASWKRAVVRLLAVTDETCARIGLVPNEYDSTISWVVFDELVASIDTADRFLNLPKSITYLVFPDKACVLPKSLTPEIGCTLRSLSHHLALLPGRGPVAANWYLSTSSTQESNSVGMHALTLLLVPFPYVVHGNDFRVHKYPEPGVDGYFRLHQGWLEDVDGSALPHDKFYKFVRDLIFAAEKDSGPIHGLVFPETALTKEYLLNLADRLAPEFPWLELCVAGTLSGGQFASRNEAVIIRFEDKKVSGVLAQSKHHRWRLDADQIGRYQLGHVLDPRFNWWESIDVHDRQIHF